MSVRPATLIQGGSRHSGARKSTITHGNEDPAFNNGTQQEELSKEDLDFGIDRLPDRYLFGISGVCRQWAGGTKDNTTTTCKRRFPQVPSLLDAVLEDADSTTVRDYWTRVLTSAKAATEKRVMLWKRLVTAAAGVLITSILWAVAVIVFTLILPQYFFCSLILAIFDADMAVTVAILWTAVGNLQSNALKAAAQEITGKAVRGQVVDAGLGVGILWGLGLCKLMVTPLMTLILFLVALLPVFSCCAALAGISDRVKFEVYHSPYIIMAEE
jgi:hypothetical protein